ncbi:Regulator of sigma E protease [Limihaloglobus sulfuriphilus]|uniref:Regulator of sigma E protease n=1 Tax=Limihaloglobus sulfuriphilus TaxID=1851148 RepID=A0A1Q2MFZ6_9BACT|nr:site-2 protease family protein [Limihaloglobus sulfuriphilus]AQQ71227.1 Regulator of sigma E protease [Limihaloglobus sulfuriphilus]
MSEIENNTDNTQQSPAKPDMAKKANWAAMFVTIAVVLYLIAANWAVSSIIIVALLGFTAMIVIHELGHFVAARSVGVACEAFSIGFGPFLLAVKQVENGLRVRIMAKTSGVKENPEQDCMFMFTIPRKCKEGETEYCLGLLPLGGFVKMLGQEDTNIVEKDDNPKNFQNKSVGARFLIVSAGVVFNVIGAFVIFTALALYGIEKMPPVVGGVLEDTPAYRAGLEPGDEFVEIGGVSMSVKGKPNLDFTHITRAAILSRPGSEVPFKVLESDGDIREITMVPEKGAGDQFPKFGIMPMSTLEIAEVDGGEELFEKYDIKPGDMIVEANGKLLKSGVELEDMMISVFKPALPVKLLRKQNGGDGSFVSIDIPLNASPSYASGSGDKLADASLCSIVPRLLVEQPGEEAAERAEQQGRDFFKSGDIVIKAADIEYPSFTEFRSLTEQYSGKSMPVTVIRDSSEVSLELVPYVPEGSDSPKVGVVFGLDLNSNVAAYIKKDGFVSSYTDIPRGVKIKSIDGKEVKSFFEMDEVLSGLAGERVSMTFEANGTDSRGSAVINAAEEDKINEIQMYPQDYLPTAQLLREYKADGVIAGVQTGVYMIYDSLSQAYATLKALFMKDSSVGAKELSGPVGIAQLSYKMIKYRGLASFLNLMGLISCLLAVMNFLPIPIVDGGHAVLLIIEKIKGSPVNMKVQQALMYVGLALILLLFVYVTFHDILRLIGLE